MAEFRSWTTLWPASLMPANWVTKMAAFPVLPTALKSPLSSQETVNSAVSAMSVRAAPFHETPRPAILKSSSSWSQ